MECRSRRVRLPHTRLARTTSTITNADDLFYWDEAAAFVAEFCSLGGRWSAAFPCPYERDGLSPVAARLPRRTPMGSILQPIRTRWCPRPRRPVSRRQHLAQGACWDHGLRTAVTPLESRIIGMIVRIETVPTSRLPRGLINAHSKRPSRSWILPNRSVRRGLLRQCAVSSRP